MRLGEVQIKIQYLIEHIGFGLFVYRDLGEGKREFFTVNGPVIVEVNRAVTKPLFLHIFEDTAQLHQLIEQAEKQGISSPTTDRIIGELTATKNHLEDMRKIVFETPKPQADGGGEDVVH